MIVADLLEGLAAAALLVLLAIGALFTRRVVIRRRGGTFDCSLRLTPGSARAAVYYGVGPGPGYAQGNAPSAIRSEGHGRAPGPASTRTNSHEATASSPAPSPGEHDAYSQRHSAVQPQHAPNSAHPGAPASFPVKRGTRTPLSAAGVRAGRGWSYGIAQYENDRIDWFRIFSYAYRPAAVLTRRDLEVLSRRDAEDHEELALFPGWTIVECRFGTGLVELAMSPDALTGFLSWIEGAPPGQNVSRVS